MPYQIINPNAEILAVHAALLPTGQVLLFGGSEHNPDQNSSGNVTDLDNTRLFDPATNSISTLGSPDTDVFCSGHALMSDGRLLIGGGTKKYGGGHAGHPHALNFLGEHACWLYHPRANGWHRVSDMRPEPGEPDGGGRWYPTLLTLGNGEVLSVAGHPDQPDSRHNNDTPERYSPAANTWSLLTAQRVDAGERSRYYPRMHLLPDGTVFFVSPVDGNCRRYDAFSGTYVGSSLPAPGGGLYNNSWDFSSVLLPLLPNEGYRARVLVVGDSDCKTIDLGTASPTWQIASGRPSTVQRRFGMAVMLPTGQVLVTGGVNGGNSDANGVLAGEIYTPGIDWNSGVYAGPHNWSPTDGSANAVRNYHSVALLLPNGQVLIAGSSKNAAAGDPNNSAIAEKRIEVFKPAYDGNPNRPTITSAPISAGYGQTFDVRSPQASQIRRVVITRCGSATHAFDSDQRLVSLQFTTGEGNVLRVTAPPNSNIAPPGTYLLWILNEAGLPCVEAKFIRICQQRIFIVADRSTFSRHEVQAMNPSATTPATFSNALYVVLEGFLPSEVGSPPVPPNLTFVRPDGSAVPGMSAQLNLIKFEDESVPPDIAQRVTCIFNIRFTSLQAFDQIPAANEFQTITLVARHGGNTATMPLTLSKNPNPYMRDGEVHWLSTDLRVFSQRPGTVRAGATLGSGASGAIAFIQQLLSNFNTIATDEDHPFFNISTDPDVSKLYLESEISPGQPIYNFAVAKVRFRAPSGISAADVRAFFRMFTTVATGMAFDPATTYARNGNGAGAAPLLGLVGGEIASIPFFAEDRNSDMRSQVDATNRRTLNGMDASEVVVYFGCWLDINQPTRSHFPMLPPHNGSAGTFAGPLVPVQSVIRNRHCCLVAEIHYPLDPIPNGATPGSHDNLSQRNLVVVGSDNPGNAATHMVETTFELKPSKIPLMTPVAFGVTVEEAPEIALKALAQAQRPRVEADELLIRWNTLPKDAHVTVYLPDVDIDSILSAAAVRNGPAMFSKHDAQTIACRVGGVTYLPVPGPRPLDIPGMFSIQLPPSVVTGQNFKVTVHQLSGFPRRVIGAFEITIMVKDSPALLSEETRHLAVMRYIAQGIPAGNRWKPVFDRYLVQISDRVRGLGGKPELVPPSPTGHPPHKPGHDDPGDQPHEPAEEVIEGYVKELIYDCMGRFHGAKITTCERTFNLHIHECGLEAVLARACKDRLRIRIEFGDDKTHQVKRLALMCC